MIGESRIRMRSDGAPEPCVLPSWGDNALSRLRDLRDGRRPAREAEEAGSSIDTFRMGLEDRLRAVPALSSLASRERELRFFLLLLLLRMPLGGFFPVPDL